MVTKAVEPLASSMCTQGIALIGTILLDEIRTTEHLIVRQFQSLAPKERRRDDNQHEKNDNLTRVGRFLRDHHLDELPQLWNVLRGDMSFVGPRPERKYYIDLIMEQDPRYERLYQLRPGVTSYATLHNGYTDTMEKMLIRLEMDLYYLEHCSLWLDIKILMQTFFSIISGRHF